MRVCLILALILPGTLRAEEPLAKPKEDSKRSSDVISALYEEPADWEPEIKLTSEWSNSHFEPYGKSQQWLDDLEEKISSSTPPPENFDNPIPPKPEMVSYIGTQFTGTWVLSRGDAGFGTLGLDVNSTIAWRFAESQAPLIFTPGFAVDHWTGALAEYLPDQVYSSYFDINWRPRVTETIDLNLGVSPGLYGDYRKIDSATLQWTGWALGDLAVSEQWHLLAGVLFVRQLESHVLPAGGVIWIPDSDTRFELVFPRPRIARRLYTVSENDWWGYVAVQYGGGAWAITLVDDSRDTLFYSDIRVVVGTEWRRPRGTVGVFEVGYLFNRQLSLTDDFAEPSSTLIVRGGLTF